MEKRSSNYFCVCDLCYFVFHLLYDSFTSNNKAIDDMKVELHHFPIKKRYYTQSIGTEVTL